jgi:mercuric ion transport protein
MDSIQSREDDSSRAKDARTSLLVSGAAAILASSCCLGPLLLMTAGFSGAWIGNLTAMEPYRPLFIGVALVALFLAWRRIWRPAVDCAPGQVCAAPSINRTYKALFAVALLLALIAVSFPYVATWFY